MTSTDTIATLAEELQQFTDWEDRYAHIIAMGKELAPYPEEFRIDQFLVAGCQSRVWLYPTWIEGRLEFHADSEAIVVKGLVAILMRIYNHRTPQEILDIPNDFVSTLDLDTHLSQNRTSGIAAMIKQIGLYARAFSKRK